MPGKRMTYPWSGWPPASQERLFKFLLAGCAGLCFAVFVGLSLFSGALGQRIAAAKQEYGLVVPLVREIATLRASRGDLAGTPPEEAVRRIVEDRVLADYVVSMRGSRISESQDGVQVTFSGLTLIMLTDFLQDVRDRASLQAPEFALTRNPGDPRLADVHMVLAR